MTDSIRENEPLPPEPAASNPAMQSAATAAESASADPGAPASEESGPPPTVSTVLEKIRRRTARTQVRSEPDRLQTLEERLLRLEALLTRRLEAEERLPVSPAGDAGPVAAPPLAAVAAPVAAVLPEAPVAAVVAAPVAEVAAPAGSTAKQSWWRAWFLVQSFNDFRLFVRMYVDPRYHMTWLGRLVPLAFVIYILLPNYEVLEYVFFWRALPVIGYILDKLVLAGFSLFTVKILAREMRRYQQVVPDVPDVLRWVNR